MGRVMRRCALRRNTLPLLRPTNQLNTLLDEGEGQRAGVHVPLESFRRDGGGFALAERGSLGLGAGERRGEGDGSGCENVVYLRMRASWVRRGRRLVRKRTCQCEAAHTRY